ncbi:MAG: zinc ABC transporter substrate-binding protein [bacterium]|nr:MAG: zinc ABC transporter substrate-binding protein [bacterium]
MQRREFFKRLISMTAVGILPDAKNLIACSIWPLYLITKEIVDVSQFEIKTIVPQWKDPHDYVLKPKDKLMLDNASLFFEIGLGIEKNMKSKKSIVLSENYPNLIGRHRVGNIVIANPHIWLDPVIVKNYILPGILNVLVKKYPSVVSIKKVKGFKERLSEMNKRFETDLAAVKSVPFITEEGAFDYFVRRYHLNLAGSVERDKSKAGSNIRWLYNLSGIIKRQNVHVLFIHAASSIEPFRIFVEDYGLKIYRLHPLGYGQSSYKSMMYGNERTILKVLKKWT